MSSTFLEAQHAAEIAVAGMALRALFAREVQDDPTVVSLAVRLSADAIPGLTVIEVESLNASGMAVAGWSL